ncbi:MAG: Eco57I restriction-modification methylase domain-containing protein [Betaproteobacteria bacterium]|nr:Eco57I restriction-modification methylase domain-containing protein [Betaproteobacteria bacterium]
MSASVQGSSGRSLSLPLFPQILSPAELRRQLQMEARASTQDTQTAFAGAIAARAVEGFWERLETGLPLLPPPFAGYELRVPTDQVATHFGRSVAGLSIVEAASQLGLLYCGLLPSEWRATHGVHYTPPSLANRLLDQAEAAGLDWTSARILDPAAGAGAFLVPAAQRMIRAMGRCDPAFALKNVSARLCGYELDPFAAWMAQVFIEAATLPTIRAAGRRPSPCIDVRDSLGVTKEQVFDLVIGNPPFGRVSLPTDQRMRYARSLYGHANLYGLFMDQAVRLARPGGLVSFLTPSSFLAGEYFKNLRAVLWHEAPPVALDFVTLRKGVFEEVLQETVLVTYRKNGARGSAVVSFIEPQSGAPARLEAAGSVALPATPTGPWILPRHSSEAVLAGRLRAMPQRLSDWGYKVSTGPLVWNRHKDQLRDEAGPGTVPLVWAECVTSDGRFVFRSEKRNHKPYFRLQPGDDWLVVRTPCVVLQRTTAKEQARRLIAAEMPASLLGRHAGVTVENHLNMLVPTVACPPVPPSLLAAFLNSAAADRAFRCLSGSVAVSAYELESLPLPAAADLERFMGREIDRADFEQACDQLYSADGAA